MKKSILDYAYVLSIVGVMIEIITIGFNDYYMTKEDYSLTFWYKYTEIISVIIYFIILVGLILSIIQFRRNKKNKMLIIGIVAPIIIIALSIYQSFYNISHYNMNNYPCSKAISCRCTQNSDLCKCDYCINTNCTKIKKISCPKNEEY